MTGYLKQIKCPNCDYEGKAAVKGAGTGLWIALLVFVLVSLVFWLLLIASAVMFIWLIFKPVDQVCPKCKYPNPIPQ